jgi:NitT/TauT family transport system permease protein
MRTAGRRWDSALVVVAVLILWELLYLYVGDTALRSPWQTLVFTVQFAHDPDFWMHLRVTIEGFAIALALAVAIGLGVGIWLGFHRRSDEIFTPLLISFAAVPKLTLYPIILLMFGVGMEAKVVFGALHGITPIAMFTLGAIGNVKPVLLKVAKVQGLSRFETIRSVLLPAALPEIFSGLRIGFSLTLIGTVLGEMFAAQRGLGYLLMTSIGLHNVDMLTSLTAILTIFAAIFSFSLLAIDRRLRRRL